MKCNFHTHSTFCDGKNTPEEMVLAAIEKNFDVLGFSGHSLYPKARSWHTPVDKFNEYTAEIRRLSDVYKDKIKIYLGFEADYFPGVTVPSKETYKEFAPDYLIGSVHYLVSDKGFFSVDNSVEKVRENLIIYYGAPDKGIESVDGKKVVLDYFDAQRQMLRKGDFEILGHCDLIRLRNTVLKYFDTNETWYRDELKAVAKEAARAGVIAEINTGAVARKLMDTFYPSQEFLQILHDAGVPVCINSDAHIKENLDSYFEEAWQAAQKAGYKELIYPVKL